MLNVKNVSNSFWHGLGVKLFYTFRCIAKNFPKARTVFQNNLNPIDFMQVLGQLFLENFNYVFREWQKRKLKLAHFVS